MIKARSFITFFFLLLCLSSFAQKVTFDAKGRKIIEYNDGTWRYFNPNSPKDVALESSQTVDNSAAQNLQDENNQTDTSALTADNVVLTRDKLSKELKELKELKEIVQSQLNDAYAGIGTYSNDQIKDLEKKIKDIKKKEKDQKLKLKDVENFIKNSKKKGKENKIQIPKVEEKINEKENTDISPVKNEKEVEVVSGPKEIVKNTEKEVSPKPSGITLMSPNDYKKRKATEDLIIFPPVFPCTKYIEDIEEFSGKKRISLPESLFFTYTDIALRNTFINNDFLECYGSVSFISGGYYSLNLKLIFNAKDIQRQYGFLEKGSILAIKLCSGESITLFNEKTNTGHSDDANSQTVYFAQYYISPEDRKRLSGSEIDKIKVVWSTGFENYEITNVDFLINQLRCISEAKG